MAIYSGYGFREESRSFERPAGAPTGDAVALPDGGRVSLGFVLYKLGMIEEYYALVQAVSTATGSGSNIATEGPYYSGPDCAVDDGERGGGFIRYSVDGDGYYTLVTGLVLWNILGDASANVLSANAKLVNHVEGAGGDDIITSGQLGDELDGGEGSDTVSYATSTAAVQVDLTLTTAQTSTGDASGDVLTSIENLIGTGLADRLTGDAGANRLEGGAGADTLDGGVGLDVASYASSTVGVQVDLTIKGPQTSSGDASGDILVSIEGLVGSSSADTLTGDAKSNTIDGGGGADTMRGGLGNDTYYVDSVDDSVSELAGQGTDTVVSSVSFTLSTASDPGRAQVENLTLTGTGAINGVGNALNNVLIGNAGANLLRGLGGNDTMRGGLGDDTYVVEDAGDVVTEFGAQGTDTVQASLSYTLTNNLENLTLTGTGSFSGTGNGLANILTGNAAANALDAGAGGDVLSGGAGGDMLTGGTGADAFLYRFLSDSTVAAGGRDRILDFSQSDHDVVDLSLIDADAGLSGNQAFAFIGAAGFSGTAGELRATSVLSNTATLISGDVNGDRAADFSILVSGQVTFGKSDFVL